MSWASHHSEASRLASEADVAKQRGDTAAAQLMYQQSALAELRALADLDRSKIRTYAITAISAVSLFYKANLHRDAEQLAHGYLAEPSIAAFARHQLQDLLQHIWAERARVESNVRFAPGQVLVSVRGGKIVTGGAPLDLILSKVEAIQSLFFRTAEMLTGLPHRGRGLPSREIQDQYAPWIFQTAPGSYQFAVSVEEPKQTQLFPPVVTGEKISGTFLSILGAAVSDPEHGLDALVPDVVYRATFLKLVRNLAPTGKTFSEMTVQKAGDSQEPISLSPAVRKSLQSSLRANAPVPESAEEVEVLRGILRAVHLDEDWLEVVLEQGPVRVHGVGATVDDVIGPMINHPVQVEVVVSRGRRLLREIEADD